MMPSANADPIISFVELAGFRGVRDSLLVRFGSGFTVITGRNGTGKSTICDAIEFALLGRLTRFDAATERRESFRRYAWWQGTTPAREQFVTVGFRGPDGEEVAVCRTPDGVEGLEDARAILCEHGGAPADFAGQICRTAILRGESIVHESVDMPERQRYALVRAAIGSDMLGEVERLRPKLLERMTAMQTNSKHKYGAMRQDVQRLQRDITEIQAQVFQEHDREAAMHTITEILRQHEHTLDGHEVSEIADAGRALGKTLRSQVERIVELAVEATRLIKERDFLLEERKRGRFDELENNLASRGATLEELGRERQCLADDEASLGKSSELMDHLAVLLQYGKDVGLRDGKCPLCAMEQEDRRYRDVLAALEVEVDANARKREALSRQLREVDARINGLQREVCELSKDFDLLRDRERRYDSDWRNLVEQADSVDLSVSMPLASGIFDEAVSLRQRMIGQLDKALSLIDSSFAAGRAKLLRTRIHTAQLKSDDAERALQKAEQARDRAKSQIDGISRAIGEVVDERLATLAPLLQELYARLRPHVDWQEIEYHLRGEVRRFLSLQVGDNLNPRFMFSSGQRRAAGLAFLLAVYLARPWCRLRTLVLDDPVQHVDDYRALHLVETLSAIGQAGHQIVCTVEDAALAQLLLRRLNAGPHSNGCYIEMDYELGAGVTVAATQSVRPAATSILASA